MPIIKYPLTDLAKQAARDLVAAWDARILPQTMLFGHYVQGKVAHPTFFDYQGNQIKYDSAPERGQLYELSHFNLLVLRTFRDANTLEVVLMQELRNAVLSDFTVSEYFLTINSSGVLNMQGGTVNIADSATRAAPRQLAQNNGTAAPAEDITETLRELLGELPNEREDLAAALNTLAVEDQDAHYVAAMSVVAALGRALNDGEDSETVMTALDTLTRHVGGNAM
jgi:hypothetical protein